MGGANRTVIETAPWQIKLKAKRASAKRSPNRVSLRFTARTVVSSLALALCAVSSTQVLAADFTVSNADELAAAISTANSNGDASNTITLAGNIDLTQLTPDGTGSTALPTLGETGSNKSLTINGAGNTVSGGGQTRIFFANSGTIAIQNVTLADGVAKGGDGGVGHSGDSGGGGMGAGGALFVRGTLDGHAAPSVTLENVALTDNKAVGGNGGIDPYPYGSSASTGGGGGLGGNGGNISSASGGGGGGALPGQNASGQTGGGPSGGAGGPAGQPGGEFSGGGGGEGLSGSGGNGGFGGGGGGGSSSVSGNGGFGGGGGASFYSAAGGNGGFGGGGGGGYPVPTAGGFGGGGGGGAPTNILLNGGGGGAGMGGGIFVMEGASLTIVGDLSVNGGSVTGGSAGDQYAGDGSAFGAGLFLQGSGSLTLAPAANETHTVTDEITDQTGSGGTGGHAGSWSITKDGAGTLVLLGNNSYSGGTVLSDGTLGAGHNNALGTGTLTVAGLSTLQIQNGIVISNATELNSTLDIDVGAGDTGTHAGAIDGTSGIIKTGEGMLILSGNSAGYTGTTDVNAGELRVTGAIASSPVNVNDGGTLTGAGVVRDVTVANGGTLSPGNGGIGTMRVVNNATFEAGSVFRVDINDGGQNSMLVVENTAALDGAVVVRAQGTGYQPVTDYTILTADNGRTGTFTGGVTTDLAFLDPHLSYDANNVFLTMIRNDADFSSVATTWNQRAVAGALQQFPTLNPLYLAMLNQNADGARQAFDALSGEVHASIAGLLVGQGRYVRDALTGRLVQALYASGAAEEAVASVGPTTLAASGSERMSLGMTAEGTTDARRPSSRLAFWTQGFGAWGSFDGDGNAASADRTLGGVVSGMDADLGNRWRAGVATGIVQSSIGVGARLSSADVTSYQLAAYAGGAAGPMALRFGSSWAWHDIETSRAIFFPGTFETATADYDGTTGQAFAEVALPLGRGGWMAEPFAGIAWVHHNTGSFTESGTTLSLHAEHADQDVGFTTLGYRTATTIPVGSVLVMARGSLAWQHAFGDVTPQSALSFVSSGIGFGIAGLPLAEHSAVIDTGIDLKLGGAVLGLSYIGQLATDSQDHGVRAKVNWRF